MKLSIKFILISLLITMIIQTFNGVTFKNNNNNNRNNNNLTENYLSPSKHFLRCINLHLFSAFKTKKFVNIYLPF